jgi:radical SAM superfamily enzyme YgiQ (UPF0313 family)
MNNKKIEALAEKYGFDTSEHYHGGFPNETTLALEDYSMEIIRLCMEQSDAHSKENISIFFGLDTKDDDLVKELVNVIQKALDEYMEKMK